jgi:hypothetical protein
MIWAAAGHCRGTLKDRPCGERRWPARPVCGGRTEAKQRRRRRKGVAGGGQITRRRWKHPPEKTDLRGSWRSVSSGARNTNLRGRRLSWPRRHQRGLLSSARRTCGGVVFVFRVHGAPAHARAHRWRGLGRGGIQMQGFVVGARPLEIRLLRR